MNWQYFQMDEFRCTCGCNTNGIQSALIDVLDDLRHECNFPFIVTSGFRCEDHPQEAVKTTPGQHFYGRAADILIDNGFQRFALIKAATFRPEIRGMGIAKHFIHLDIRTTDRVCWVYD